MLEVENFSNVFREKIKRDLRKKQKFEAQIEDFQKEYKVVEERMAQLQMTYK